MKVLFLVSLIAFAVSQNNPSVSVVDIYHDYCFSKEDVLTEEVFDIECRGDEFDNPDTNYQDYGMRLGNMKTKCDIYSVPDFCIMQCHFDVKEDEIDYSKHGLKNENGKSVQIESNLVYFKPLAETASKITVRGKKYLVKPSTPKEINVVYSNGSDSSAFDISFTSEVVVPLPIISANGKEFKCSVKSGDKNTLTCKLNKSDFPANKYPLSIELGCEDELLAFDKTISLVVTEN